MEDCSELKKITSSYDEAVLKEDDKLVEELTANIVDHMEECEICRQNYVEFAKEQREEREEDKNSLHFCPFKEKLNYAFASNEGSDVFDWHEQFEVFQSHAENCEICEHNSALSSENFMRAISIEKFSSDRKKLSEIVTKIEESFVALGWMQPQETDILYNRIWLVIGVHLKSKIGHHLLNLWNRVIRRSMALNRIIDIHGPDTIVEISEMIFKEAVDDLIEALMQIQQNLEEESTKLS